MAYTNKTSGEYRCDINALKAKQTKLHNDLLDQVKRFCKAFPEAKLIGCYTASDLLDEIKTYENNELLLVLKKIEKHIEDNAKWKQTNIFDNK